MVGQDPEQGACGDCRLPAPLERWVLLPLPGSQRGGKGSAAALRSPRAGGVTSVFHHLGQERSWTHPERQVIPERSAG